MIKTSLAALLLVTTAPALAQPTTPPVGAPAEQITNDEAEIVILGFGGEPFRLTSDRLRDAVKTFSKNRARYAPQATLEWRVHDFDPADAPQLALTDRKSGDRFPLELDSTGRFVLPADRILDRKLDLVADRRAGQVRIMPEVFSPGGDALRHRVGDARLGCRVMAAYMDNDFSPFLRLAFRTVGGCASKRFSIMWSGPEDRPLERVFVSDWNGEIVLSENRKAYRLPVHLEELDDEQMIELVYPEADRE
ncbi:hypothetical protein WJS89_02435 [Sphingomicrobium sp. XHP0235]|uniref:hypothetical protein n=1 Tax=Sphingomicrobium aquimarinum TaxID=3133971 RepID=UPI0031FE454A